MKRGLPGGPVVKNSPCNAGDRVSSPVLGTKTPHTAEQLSQSDKTRKLMRGKKKIFLPGNGSSACCD